MRRLCVDGRTKHPSFGDSPGGSNHSDWVQAWKILVDLSVQCARWGNQGSGTWLGQGGTYLQTAFSPPSGIHARSWGLAALSYAPPYPHTKLTGNEVVSNLNSVVKDRNSTQIANIHWVIEKAREFQKNINFCFVDYAKAFECVDHDKLENSERAGDTRPPDLPPEKPVCRTRSNS